MSEKKILKKYVSLGDQAEALDSYEAYKEKIETIQNMKYEELYNIMRDTEDALKVLCRGEAKAQQSGILVMTKEILKLATLYQERFGFDKPKLPNLEYTYEYIEREAKKKTLTS